MWGPEALGTNNEGMVDAKCNEGLIFSEENRPKSHHFMHGSGTFFCVSLLPFFVARTQQARHCTALLLVDWASKEKRKPSKEKERKQQMIAELIPHTTLVYIAKPLLFITSLYVCILLVNAAALCLYTFWILLQSKVNHMCSLGSR